MTETLLDYADRMWRGEVAVDGLLSSPSLAHKAAEVTSGVAMVPGWGNVIAFRTDDGLVLFDTGSAMTAGMSHAAVRRWSTQPLRYAIYSHGHIDHVSGARLFDEEAAENGWERPVVVSHEALPARFDRYLRTLGYNTAVNRRQFADPTLRWPRNYRYPDQTYRDRMTLDTGGVTFELHHARGETDDHTWAYIPQYRVLCTGDLFIWVSPNAGNPQKVQRYPVDWAAALRAMAECGAELLLPGHGPPVHGAQRVATALADTAEYLESLVDQTLELMNSGATLDKIIHSVRPTAHLAAKPYLRPHYDEPEFVVRNIWRLYGGWYDGNPARLKPAPDAQLAQVVADLAGGTDILAERAERAADDGDLRLACHLAELAAQAAPGDTTVHATRARVYGERARTETSLMAKGVFRWAARESQEIVDRPDEGRSGEP